jgi:Gram-negative bacterial TonB protein C-terminal
MHILQGMILRSIFLAVLAIMMVGISGAQGTQPGFPSQVLVARHTYFDFGPPFDFYEVLSLKDEGSSTSVQRILVTPAGNACIQPPTVEVTVATIGKSLPDVMQGKNPCDIPERGLRQERKRCKHCLNLSGVNVTLSVSCKKGDRQIRADILDRDLFDSSARTPPNTSWTMALLSQIDATLGPGVMDKPAFSVGAPGSDLPKPSDSVMLESLKVGKYDVLFDSDKKLSEIYRESLEPSRLPSVEILRMTPTAPLSADPPPYPPIARVAHVQGEVSISFEVSPFGKVEQLSFESGPEMLRRAVSDTSSKWQFPESSEVHHEEGTIAFRLNCPQPRP